MVRKKRILLLEDELTLRNLFAFVMKDNGFDTIAYESPAYFPIGQCSECLNNGGLRCADIILTDIAMPKVSGIDFIEGVVKNSCKIKDIGIMSGVWTNESILRAEKLQCTIFEKPVSLITLTNWLKECDQNNDAMLFDLLPLTSIHP